MLIFAPSLTEGWCTIKKYKRCYSKTGKKEIVANFQFLNSIVMHRTMISPNPVVHWNQILLDVYEHLLLQQFNY